MRKVNDICIWAHLFQYLEWSGTTSLQFLNGPRGKPFRSNPNYDIISYLKLCMTSMSVSVNFILRITWIFFFLRISLCKSWIFHVNASADLEILTCGDMGKRSKGFLGVYPCTTSKGLASIDLLTKLLYASWAVGRIESQFRLASPIRHRRRLPRLRLTTSVWASIWGWNAVENFNLVPTKCHKVIQK